MRATSLLRTLLCQKHTKVTGFEFTDSGLVADVAPTTRLPRCGSCGRKVRQGYDGRERHWRHLDFAGMRVELRYRIRRVDCPCCGVQTELVPWAEPGSSFSRDFEDVVALLAQKTDKTTICELMGIAWETVGNIARRVLERRGPSDLLDDLTRIGMDEISYKRHHHYLTIVTDHERRRVVWVGVGRSKETLSHFFTTLGKERAAKLELVSLDMLQSYIEMTREHAPQATLVFDRFHLQRLAQDAVDKVRRELVRELRGTEEGMALKKTRWALLKRPWNVNVEESRKLAGVQRENRQLYRAYLLKETLCDILDRRQPNVAHDLLVDWMAWAQRCRLEPFRKLGRTIAKHLDGIVEYVRTRLSNGIAEGMNSKIRTATKQAYGFRDSSSLTAMIYLRCSGVVIPPIRHYPHAA
jgi:transposase